MFTSYALTAKRRRRQRNYTAIQNPNPETEMGKNL